MRGDPPARAAVAKLASKKGRENYGRHGRTPRAPSGSADDCNDTNAGANVGETEVWYDGIDANCDGLSDFDQDQDGQMAAAYGGADCDDTDPAILMGSVEIWYDGIDGDCGEDDDYDSDGDGYVACSAVTVADLQALGLSVSSTEHILLNFTGGDDCNDDVWCQECKERDAPGWHCSHCITD